jgi:hypothetical protein
MAGIAGYQGKVIRHGNGCDFKVGKIKGGSLFFQISPEPVSMFLHRPFALSALPARVRPDRRTAIYRDKGFGPKR